MPRLGSDSRLEPYDRRIVDRVKRHGWQVTIVGSGRCERCADDATRDDGPAFAYTVGLPHRAGHPELAMSGQSAEVMHAALNRLAEQVVHHGLRVRPGDVLETVLSNVPVTVDPVSRAGLNDIGLVSAWFHRRPVDALQIVWPTISGVFAWQPGAPAELEEQQPRAWRVPTLRTGALGIDPPWCLPIPPEEIATVCTHMRHENEPLRFVVRHTGPDGEDYWDFDCGREHGPGIDDLLSEHVAHTVRAAPSIRAVADLRPGEFAERADAFSPWRRGDL